MTTNVRQPSPTITTAGDIGVNLDSFRRHLRAANLAHKTQLTYTGSVYQLAMYLQAQGMPTMVADITREHLEEFISHLLARWKPATANNRYRGLQQFFRYLEEEGEIKQTPMAKMRPPRIPEESPNVLDDEELRILLRTCEGGQSFEQRRDAALFRVFVDTGARLSEVANVRWNPEDEDSNDVDLDQGLIRLLGKGRRWRLVSVGPKACKMLDRYLRRRSQHQHARLPWLWLGQKGRMTDSGIRQMFWRRSKRAGLGKIHPHQLRHTFAHRWLSADGSEGDLMRITGWRSRQMLQRYAASTAEQRSIAASKKLGLGERL